MSLIDVKEAILTAVKEMRGFVNKNFNQMNEIVDSQIFLFENNNKFIKLLNIYGLRDTNISNTLLNIFDLDGTETKSMDVGILRSLRTTQNPTFVDKDGNFYVSDIGMYVKDSKYGILQNISVKHTKNMKITSSFIATWFKNRVNTVPIVLVWNTVRSATELLSESLEYTTSTVEDRECMFTHAGSLVIRLSYERLGVTNESETDVIVTAINNYFAENDIAVTYVMKDSKFVEYNSTLQEQCKNLSLYTNSSITCGGNMIYLQYENTITEHIERHIPMIENVMVYGVSNKGDIDCSDILQNISSDILYFPKGFYLVSYDWFNSNDKKLVGEGILKFKDWSSQWLRTSFSNLYNGFCKIDKLIDSIYIENHVPSEFRTSFDNRTNSTVTTVYKFDENFVSCNPQGAIELIEGKDYPDTFTICMGKARLLGFVNGRWTLLKESFPTVKLYPADFSKDTSVAIDKECIHEYGDYRSYSLTKEMMNTDDIQRCIHFWISYNPEIDSITPSDIEYVCLVFQAWIQEKEFEDTFVIKSGLDMITESGEIYELGMGRWIGLKHYKRNALFYNVPDDVYEKIMGSTFNVWDSFSNPIVREEVQYSNRLILTPTDSCEDNTSHNATICKIYFPESSSANRIYAEIDLKQQLGGQLQYGKFFIFADLEKAYINSTNLSNEKDNMVCVRIDSEEKSITLFTNNTSWTKYHPIFVDVNIDEYTYGSCKIEYPKHLLVHNALDVYNESHFIKTWIEDDILETDICFKKTT